MCVMYQVGAYYTYMTDLVTMLGADRTQAELQMLEVLIFETQLANISLSRELRRDSSSLYNPMRVGELSRLDAGTPWLEYLNRLLTRDTVQVTEDEVIIVDVPNYVRDLGSLLRATPARVQANYLMWRAAASSAPYLSHRAELIRLRFKLFQDFCLFFIINLQTTGSAPLLPARLSFRRGRGEYLAEN